MQQSTYDPCLLYINKKGFGVVGLQIDYTLILENETFANVENFHLHETKLLAKKKKETHLTALNKIQWCSHQTGKLSVEKLSIPLFKSETPMQELTFDNTSIKRSD